MPRSLQPMFTCGGLNTKANATGLDPLEPVVLQDMRVVGKDWIQRPGIVRVGQVAGGQKALDFTAASSDMLSCAVDSRVWTLGKYWTFEMLIEPDSVTGTQGLAGFNHATTWPISVYLSGTDIIAKVTDVDDAVVTLNASDQSFTGAVGTKYGIQVVRSGTSLTMRVNNAYEETGTMADKNCKVPTADFEVAVNAANDYYDGTIDYIRLYSYARSNHADYLVRNPAPRAEYVLADYDMNVSASGVVYDRSRYENHLLATNVAAGDEVTSLCHGPDPVRALGMGVDGSQRKQLMVCCGGLYYLATGD